MNKYLRNTLYGTLILGSSFLSSCTYNYKPVINETNTEVEIDDHSKHKDKSTTKYKDRSKHDNHSKYKDKSSIDVEVDIKDKSTHKYKNHEKNKNMYDNENTTKNKSKSKNKSGDYNNNNGSTDETRSREDNNAKESDLEKRLNETDAKLKAAEEKLKELESKTSTNDENYDNTNTQNQYRQGYTRTQVVIGGGAYGPRYPSRVYTGGYHGPRDRVMPVRVVHQQTNRGNVQRQNTYNRHREGNSSGRRR